jgi:hypothetical protein
MSEQKPKTLQVRLVAGLGHTEVSVFDLATFTLVASMRKDQDELVRIGTILRVLPRPAQYLFNYSAGDKLLHFSRRLREAGADVDPIFAEVERRVVEAQPESDVRAAILAVWAAVDHQPADVAHLEAVRRRLLDLSDDGLIEANALFIVMVGAFFSMVKDATDNEGAVFEIAAEHDMVLRVLPTTQEHFGLPTHARF